MTHLSSIPSTWLRHCPTDPLQASHSSVIYRHLLSPPHSVLLGSPLRPDVQNCALTMQVLQKCTLFSFSFLFFFFFFNYTVKLLEDALTLGGSFLFSCCFSLFSKFSPLGIWELCFLDVFIMGKTIIIIFNNKASSVVSNLWTTDSQCAIIENIYVGLCPWFLAQGS